MLSQRGITPGHASPFVNLVDAKTHRQVGRWSAAHLEALARPCRGFAGGGSRENAAPAQGLSYLYSRWSPRARHIAAFWR